MITGTTTFQPVAAESLTVFNSSTAYVANAVDRRICVDSGKVGQTLFLFQCVFVEIQSFNSAT